MPCAAPWTHCPKLRSRKAVAGELPPLGHRLGSMNFRFGHIADAPHRFGLPRPWVDSASSQDFKAAVGTELSPEQVRSSVRS